MKHVLLGAALATASVAPAFAQQAPAPAATPAPGSNPAASAAPAATAAPLNGDSPIEAIAANPAGKASMEKNLNDVLTHPAYEQFKGMSLRALAPLSGGIITDEKIAAVEADLKTPK